MKKKNHTKESYLAKIPTASIDRNEDTLAQRCKFNFSYFDGGQDAGQNFTDWTHEQLHRLLTKLVHYSKETLQHWTKTPIGRGSGNVLAIYGNFPNNSDFTLPISVPHQAQWARFRLESDCRLVGFVIPNEYDNKLHNGTGRLFCCNTFYVVFLDKDHRFYKS